MLIHLVLLLGIAQITFASDYNLGHGYRISESTTVGGYFSSEVKFGEDIQEYAVDDIAVLVYGNLTSLSYMVELEAAEFYTFDAEANNETWSKSVAIERLYFDYQFSDALSIRTGKQISPIGYWNLQPINVLRETTSNPALSREMFPKFLSGIDFHGYVPFASDLSYHFYVQVTEDIDDEYINIPIDKHIGASFEKTLGPKGSWGAALGQFEELHGEETTYLQVNSKYAFGRYKWQGEINHARREGTGGLEWDKTAAYIQGELHFSPKHAGISRLEYLRDEATDRNEKLFILGYSFRPQYPISLKLEYQWHSESRDNR